MNLNCESETRALNEAFDYVIVGSGAAGSAAARVLVDTGATVAVVEEGPAVTAADFSDRSYTAMRIYRKNGFQTTSGRSPTPVLQASCLGGTTVINSAIVQSLPGDVWKVWESKYGLGKVIPLEAVHQRMDQIEKELSIRTTAPEIAGRNNELLKIAAQNLGITGKPTRRYESGCCGSALCSLGCPSNAKQSMLVSYLPYASARGARLICSARVERILFKGSRAVGVRGFFHTGQRQRSLAPFSLHARRGVLVAASAIQTPLLLAKSGLRSPHLGRHFQSHPGASVIGVFGEPVNIWIGATQGYESDQHRLRGRYKIETLSLPPELVFSRLPGVGRAWVQSMAEAGHMAVWAVQLWASAQGSVSKGLLGTEIRYEPNSSDIENLRQGIYSAAKLLFAAGAQAVLPGIHGLPDRLTSPDQLRQIESGPSDPASYSLALTHLFGTARMSPWPSAGVVGADFAVHGTQNCYVIDSSIFPTNLGTNPQHTIMAVAMHAAGQISKRG
jgi:choline dehydrogenase-like flavoprotein